MKYLTLETDTSNMGYHLEKYHPNLWADVKKDIGKSKKGLDSDNASKNCRKLLQSPFHTYIISLLQWIE